MNQLTIVLAYPWTDDNDATYSPDSIVTIDAATARSLISSGRARAAVKPPPAPAPDKPLRRGNEK